MTLKKEDFKENEPLLCSACGERETTHEVSISVSRGFDYQHNKRLFYVTYSVCGDCARSIVEVKLNTQLLAKGKK